VGTFGTATAVRVDGATVYVYNSQGTPSLSVFDCADPTSPAMKLTIPIPSDLVTDLGVRRGAFQVSGHLAYVATNIGLVVIDVSGASSTAPHLAWRSGGFTGGVDLLPPYVVVTDNKGISVLEVPPPR